MERNTFKILKTVWFIFLLIGVIGCKSEHDEEVNNDNSSFEGLKEAYTVDRFKVLNIAPKINGKITWSINDSIISENSELDFISPVIKTYPLQLKIENNGTVQTYTSSIIVKHETGTYSKYISDVLDYRPAVGQFMNEIPEYDPGNTAGQMLQKVKSYLVGANSFPVSLGGYGGYVVVGFDHTIPNLKGNDFKILGNAFWASEAIRYLS